MCSTQNRCRKMIRSGRTQRSDLTPHTSFAGDGGRDRWDQLFLDNIVRYVNGEALEREVNPADIT